VICTKCGELMDQTDKNSFSGRVIREYECRKCGHTDWEDDGVALWKVMHDAREEDEAEAAAQAAANAVAPAPANAAPAQPKPQPSAQPVPRSFWQRFVDFVRSGK
jgi:predicted  nucleic acid-binding Zn-ribbon protein